LPRSGWASWLTPWRRRAVPMAKSSITYGSQGCILAAAGRSTSCWERSDALTEEEWLTCTDPDRMLDFLHGRASERKLRLFAVACFRGSRNVPDDERCRFAVEVLGRRAEGTASIEDRRRAGRDAREVHHEIEGMAHDERSQALSFAALILYRLLVASSAAYAARDASHATRLSYHDGTGQESSAVALNAGTTHSSLIRELFGNPFRAVAIDLAWTNRNGGTVARLAQSVYEEQAFDRLPILADALEEAGCNDQDILTHLRGPGPHTRGCWPLDAILGKT
jgi:hypothetical protein